MVSRSGNPSQLDVQPRPRWLTAAVCLFLALAVWAVFGQTIHYEFTNYDDDDQVYEHPVVKDGLSWQGIVWVFTHSDDGHWIPLNKISHMLDCQFYGLKPGGHHLTNVLLHAAAAILLFLVLRRMTAAIWPSAFVAAVFAIHPLRVESVAWVTERKDVLSGFFFMLTLWAYARYVQKTEIRGWPSPMRTLFYIRQPLTSIDYWIALLFFACGLLSKAMVATLPLLLLLLDYWPLNRFLRPEPAAAMDRQKRLSVFKRLILEKIPFLGLIVAVGMGLLFSRDRNNVVVAVALQAGRGLVPHRDLSPMVRMGHALLTPLVYLKQMFFPAGLAVFSPPGQNVPCLEMFMAVILLMAVSVVVLVRRRKQPYLVTGWFWYLVMLAPILILIQQGAELRSDRYTYLPQIGLYILVAWGAADLFGHWRYRCALLGSTAAAVLACLLVGAYVQTGYWKNSISLWTHTLACASENPKAHNNFGSALAIQGKWNEAMQHYEQALRLNPDYADAHINLGAALARQGKLAEAIEHYERALQIHPEDAGACNNLGFVLAAQGKREQAIEYYERALQLKPDSVDAHFNLGNALAAQGNLAQAIEHYEQALQLKPDYADAHNNLGNALARQGKLGEAIKHYNRALQLKPDYADAHVNLGGALATQGNLAEAMQHYERALQLKPDDAYAHYNWGDALTTQGKLAEAVQHFQQALTLATARGDTALADTIRTRLESYQSALPRPQTP